MPRAFGSSQPCPLEHATQVATTSFRILPSYISLIVSLASCQENLQSLISYDTFSWVFKKATPYHSHGQLARKERILSSPIDSKHQLPLRDPDPGHLNVLRSWATSPAEYLLPTVERGGHFVTAQVPTLICIFTSRTETTELPWVSPRAAHSEGQKLYPEFTSTPRHLPHQPTSSKWSWTARH